MIAAILLGFLGSFHCIGMCGPIALTLPVHHLQGGKKMGGILLYNAGRVAAYMLMGLLFGWLGRQFYIGGWQQGLSIALGVLLLASVIFHRYFRRLPRFTIWQGKIKTILGRLLAKQQFRTLAAIGFFNGFLPCGLVYLGIAGALATGDILQGALFMGAFGAGTLPAMVAVSWFGQLITLQWRTRIRRLIPVMVSMMAVLLILRGLNLGIPYISPAMQHTEEKVTVNCCHKPA
ncbi:sulfite exporter TauE/SafE family protein [Chitinophaga cymbidii]|uniref:Membrane protein n=1 Tax=Chitinophaga cymbidii TaxID=1096750 RepID=A0A512RE28_9BACT|nr:sulfite exporter TauE/SafE family protein [Chitinophaga cymbidii]GEP93949.1 membrane protein [Chitinophaga cymbidii]